MAVYCSYILHGHCRAAVPTHVQGGWWRQQYVVNAFSRDRFTELLGYFHIAEPTPLGVKRTVIEKIAPLWDHRLAIFPDYFPPPQALTLDETMVRFKGRSAGDCHQGQTYAHRLSALHRRQPPLPPHPRHLQGEGRLRCTTGRDPHCHSASHTVVWQQPHPLHFSHPLPSSAHHGCWNTAVR